MTVERQRNPRGEGGRLREEVLDAALALLDESGDPAALTLRGIARRAGISAPPIYAHFADLPTLVDAVRERCFDDLRGRLRASVEGEDGDPAAALVAAGTAYVRFGWEHRARYRLMFAAEGYATNAVDTFRVVESLIAEAGHSDDPRTDAWLLWAGLHGVATLERPARSEQRRLGPLDRPAMLVTMIRRLARLEDGPTPDRRGDRRRG